MMITNFKTHTQKLFILQGFISLESKIDNQKSEIIFYYKRFYLIHRLYLLYKLVE